MADIVKQLTEAEDFALDSNGILLHRRIKYYVFVESPQRGGEEDACLLALAEAPKSYKLTFGNIVYTLSRKDAAIDERINAHEYKVSVSFERASYTHKGEDEESSYEFSTSGGSMHVTNGLKSPKRYGGGGSYPGGIGADGKGGFAGVDIPATTIRFSETHYFSPHKFSTRFRAKLARLSCTVNAAVFRGYEPGEVLFEGVTSHRQGDGRDDNWQVTFSFAVRKNESGVTVGDITIPKKRGWDYAWPEYRRVNRNGEVVDKLKAVWVEQVFEYANFRELGIN